MKPLHIQRMHSAAFKTVIARYSPKAWDGRMIHVWAAERPEGMFRDPDFICGHLPLNGFTFYQAPGYHASMLADANIPALAGILAAELEACEFNVV